MKFSYELLRMSIKFIASRIAQEYMQTDDKQKDRNK